MGLLGKVFAVVGAVMMQEQALRIFEDKALQSELIADGVEIAKFVVYVLQNEDACIRSEFNALRHLSLLQAAETSWTSNETMQKRMVRIAELRIAEGENIIAKTSS